MGVRKESVSKAFSGNKSYLTNTFILKFNNAFDNMFNNDWLMEGKGEMLKNNQSIGDIKNSSVHGVNVRCIFYQENGYVQRFQVWTHHALFSCSCVLISGIDNKAVHTPCAIRLAVWYLWRMRICLPTDELCCVARFRVTFLMTLIPITEVCHSLPFLALSH